MILFVQVNQVEATPKANLPVGCDVISRGSTFRVQVGQDGPEEPLMVIRKQLLVLANSVKKKSGRCIAGREIIAPVNNKVRIGPWLRPVANHGEGEIWPDERLYHDERQVAVLDFAGVPLEGKVDDACQPENWRLASGERWDDVSMKYHLKTLASLQERPDNLWLQPHQPSDRVTHEYLNTHAPTQSLYIVRPEDFRLSFWSYLWDGAPRKKRRCVFRYNGTEYDLGLTDPVLSDQYENKIPAPGNPALVVRLDCGDNVLLCISLAGQFQGYHYKVVATVFEGVK
jgi:hypothetical protein